MKITQRDIWTLELDQSETFLHRPIGWSQACIVMAIQVTDGSIRLLERFPSQDGVATIDKPLASTDEAPGMPQHIADHVNSLLSQSRTARITYHNK